MARLLRVVTGGETSAETSNVHGLPLVKAPVGIPQSGLSLRVRHKKDYPSTSGGEMRYLSSSAILLFAVVAIGVRADIAGAALCTFGGTAPPANVSVSTACEGPLSGIDSVATISAVDPFGISTWQLAHRLDGLDFPLADKSIRFAVGYRGEPPTLPGAGYPTGLWFVDSFDGFVTAMITLRWW